MGERMEMVFLDTTYYPGKDLYSDGAIEDEMLSLPEITHRKNLTV